VRLFPNSWSGFAFASLRIVIAIYLVILVLLFFCQERLIFFPSRLAAEFQFQFKLPVEEKFLEVVGSKIHSLLFRVPSSRGLILYFHGNADNLASWGEVAEELADKTSMSVWIIDYPGYGKSEGQVSSEAQLHSIAAAFMDAAKVMEATTGKIVVYGRSIGSGLAVKLASEYKPAALILESPYYSLQDIAETRFPWAPLFLLKYKFHSDLWMPNVSCPVLIIHGEQDEVIPFSQGKRLAELNKQKTFVSIRGGHHNDLAQFYEYWSSIKKFISVLSGQNI
jgi:uncharacterized protein